MAKLRFFILASSAALLYPLSGACACEGNGTDIVYKISIDEPAKSEIRVEAAFNKVPAGGLTLSETGVPEHTNLSGLRAENEKGLPLPVKISTGTVFGKRSYLIKTGGGKMKISYSAAPSGLGRHGHAGYLDSRFGLIEGSNLFLLPRDGQAIGKISVEFKLPAGWEAVHPWPESGNAAAPVGDYSGHRLDARTALNKAIIAFGGFRSCEKEFGGFKVRIYTFSGWPAERSGSICERAFKLTEYQVKLFGFKERWDYTAIFVPEAEDAERRVFGGSHALGQAYEMEKPSRRRWELFSHRLHHAFNRYPPLGMNFGKKDLWFSEATASYYELKALSSSGYYRLEDALFRMYESYKNRREENDGSLSSESLSNPEKERFLHYIKAPLVAHLLDEKIREDTKGAKDLDMFLRHIYSAHGTRRGEINVRGELEKFTGSDLGAFFGKYVDGTEKIKLKFGFKKYVYSKGKPYLILLFVIILLINIFSAFKAKIKKSSNLVK